MFGRTSSKPHVRPKIICHHDESLMLHIHTNQPVPTAIFLVFGNRFDVWGAWFSLFRCCSGCRHRRNRSSSSGSSSRIDINTRSLAIHVTLDTVADYSVGSPGVYETGDDGHGHERRRAYALDVETGAKGGALPVKLPMELRGGL